MASRIVEGEIFGLDKLLRPGTQIHTQVVGEYHDKALCAARIARFAEDSRVPAPACTRRSSSASTRC